MAVLAKVSTLRERLPSVLVDLCLYYCCTAHQALAALRSLCTEGCARTVRSMCVGVRNVIHEFIWTSATVLFAKVRTGYFDAYCRYTIGKYGSTSYIGMDRKKMAANRKGIGPTTLKHACNSTTNTCTKYLLVVMHKTLCSVWLTFVRRENETVQNCPIVLQYSSSYYYREVR